MLHKKGNFFNTQWIQNISLICIIDYRWQIIEVFITISILDHHLLVESALHHFSSRVAFPDYPWQQNLGWSFSLTTFSSIIVEIRELFITISILGHHLFVESTLHNFNFEHDNLWHTETVHHHKSPNLAYNFKHDNRWHWFSRWQREAWDLLYEPICCNPGFGAKNMILQLWGPRNFDWYLLWDVISSKRVFCEYFK